MANSTRRRLGLVLTLPTVAAGALLSACGASGGAPTRAIAATSPAMHRQVLTAAEIITRMMPSIPGTRMTVVYTAATDVNHLLGRPGGYTSKASFTDSRVPSSAVAGASTGDVALGGGVEVFTTPAGAQRRGRYLQTLFQNEPMLGTEYDYVAGDALLRVSGVLTPEQAQVDVNAFRAVIGQPAVLASP